MLTNDNVILSNYYYRNFKNRNIKIHCRDTIYTSGLGIDIIPTNIYDILKATNRLSGSLIIHEFRYKLDGDDKSMRFAFKIVSDKEFDLYKEMVPKIEKEIDGEIIRPKKIS